MKIKKIKIKRLEKKAGTKLIGYADVYLDKGLILKEIGLHRNLIKEESLSLTFPAHIKENELVRYFDAVEPFLSTLKAKIEKELKNKKNEEPRSKIQES